jgi:hypothetical protein
VGFNRVDFAVHWDSTDVVENLASDALLIGETASTVAPKPRTRQRIREYNKRDRRRPGNRSLEESAEAYTTSTASEL